MAGLTPSLQLQQQQQQHHLAGSAVSGTSATAGEEDAFKRNTDCVYFLASPLTCKKGIECEYRHSEIARLNPRDCYYWINGNCLNPKCGFRHPPLEGLLGAQVPTPVGASVPPSLAASTPVAPASFGPGPGKQPVSCIFFQKGYCMKGDWCPFLHAPPNSVSNKVLPSQAPATTAEPPTLRKPFTGPEKVTQQKMPPQVNVPKAVELPSQAKPAPRVGYAPTKAEPAKERKHPASGVGEELSRQRTSGVPFVDNGTQVSWSSRFQQPMSLKDNISMNGKDAEEEISREPSPGFDVLVDDELGDSAYYPSEDQFGRPDDREGGNEYFDRHSGDYKSMVDAEPDIYHETRGYDSYERHQGQYGWEQRKSSERKLSGLPVNRERSRRSRTRSPDPVRDSDLRYRLSKQSRTSGLRSVIHQDDAHERPDHRSYQKTRDVHRDYERRDNSLGSSRLRGRIKMPGRSSDNGNELQRGRNTEWPRPQTGGLSQGRFQHPARLQNRMKDTVGVEDDHNNYRNNRSLPIRRETRNDADFAPPKRLSELKSHKTVETNDQHVNHQTSDSKRKYSKAEYPQDAAGDLSFDGPKPLEEILKRKRVNEKSDSGSSDGNLNNNRNKMEESLMNHADKASEQQTENAISKSTSGVNKIEKESTLLTDEAEVGEVGGEMMVEDGEVGGDEDAEHYAAEDDVEYYEQVDGEEEAYELDEVDNGGDPEEEYLDEDDDDDDFAKKMGVMY